MAGCVSAGALDNILSNLGSDLAPLLALFGEQATIQYLSESLTWVDNFIFALGPIGIITAIASAIRVAGSPGLRSLIGRAKEGRGTVEAELMSSTSSDVCELWNGEGVVRVLGSPTVLLQLVYVPSKDRLSQDKPEHEIYTFSDAVGGGIYREKQKAKKSGCFGRHHDVEAKPLLGLPDNPPNLAPNVETRSLPQPWLLALGVIGVFLQIGVLVFAALVQYRPMTLAETEDPVPEYAFYILLGGTLLLSVGMFLCARIIERSTSEAYWEPAEGYQDVEVVWLQKGGHTVGDQLFESFAKRSKKGITIMTSVKVQAHTTRDNARRQLWVVLAVGASLVGFTAQFVGFRATHPYVTLAQLALISVMTIIRSCVHIERKNENAIENSHNQPDGNELDWLAKALGECQEWEIQAGLKNQYYSTETVETDVIKPSTNSALTVMKTRARLADLSRGWQLQNRTKVQSLRNAIEATIKQVYDGMTLKEKFETLSEFSWALKVRTRLLRERSSVSEINLTLSREKDDIGNWNDWHINENDLEAALCLWISYIREHQSPEKPHEEFKNVRLLGPAPDNNDNDDDYKLWIERGTSLNKSLKISEKTTRYFGWAGNINYKDGDTAPILNVNAKEDLETLCAQEIYTSFMFKLGGIIKNVGGKTTPRTNNPTTERISESNGPISYYLVNSNLASLAASYNSSGLGSIENAYLCIVPALHASKCLPVADKVLTGIKKLWSDGRQVASRLSSDDGHAVLQAAAADGLHKIIEWLLEVGAKADGPPGELSRRTSLQAAAEHGHDKTVQLLLTNGANVNAKPAKNSGRTALQAAIGGGHIRTIRLLLKNNADVEDTPADIEGRTALQAAAQAGDAAIVQLLLDSKANVKAPPGRDSGRTALQAAAECGSVEVVRLLCNAGADVNEDPGEIRGCTALYAAAKNNYIDIVRFLVEKGAVVDTYSSGGTALQVAAQGGHESVVRLLLKRQADADAAAVEDNGRTALQAAAEGGHFGLLQMLLNAKARINAPPAKYSGLTALQAGAKGGHEAIVQWLLKNGAEVNAAGAENGGRTALRAAVEGGHEGVVRMLLNKKAYVNTVRREQQAQAEDGNEKFPDFFEN